LRISLLGLADQFFVSEALSKNLLHRRNESLSVICIFPIVESERLFVNIAEQVKRFNGYVSPIYAALQKTPEVLNPIGVDLPVHIRFGVVDHLMFELIAESS
jgi:hypothetical protein